ncbi:phage head closure protein [Sedimentitalea todarodis]|uniref:Phage head closure protein n=1 Tax=Sedimentitalea todarodis TaxID=1631240 RepID=A0ABU3VHV0_9RHOB|nr:phage head closure protein [Sedimentitalea todarodis]MDU9005745.1 phage head closure protein [Sedimentitalea todarodis]
MRSGKMRRVIQVQRVASEVNDAGTPQEVWTDHLRLRAELVERTASEFINAQGAGDKALTVFRIRYVENVTNSDRVVFGGQTFNIKEISEIDHMRSLELRCEKIGAD